MVLKSKILMMLAAVGHGVLFSMALTGGVRIACWLLGTELPSSAAGNLFLAGSAVAGAISAYAYGRRVRRNASQSPPASSPDQHFSV